MPRPEDHQADMAALPEALRQLLRAELAAGNGIAEVGHSFPAPPIGAYFKLTRPLQSRPRASGDGMVYYARNNSLYAGEITDEQRHFFLLEPPLPPEPVPDMDAIRAGRQPRGVPPPVANPAMPGSETETGPLPPHASVPPPAGVGAGSGAPLTARQRFERSLVMDFDKWHDGTGYDLAALGAMTRAEQADAVQLLVNRGVNDWRDVEALASIALPAARTALLAAMRSDRAEIRHAVTRYTPDLVSEAERAASLVHGLETGVFFGGLAQTLDQVAAFHPPAIVDALFRGALVREGEVAAHFAAMLCYVHGKAAEPFDWQQRPFFLRFHTNDRTERATVFRELCGKSGVDPAPYLDADVAR